MSERVYKTGDIEKNIHYRTLAEVRGNPQSGRCSMKPRIIEVYHRVKADVSTGVIIFNRNKAPALYQQPR